LTEDKEEQSYIERRLKILLEEKGDLILKDVVVELDKLELSG
jgi:hypothetical protein